MNVYLIQGNVAKGPYAVEQVAAMVRGGEYSIATLAWHEGMNKWNPIHTMPDVANILPPQVEVKSPNQLKLKCPYCGSRYPDGMLVCSKDETPLSSNPSEGNWGWSEIGRFMGTISVWGIILLCIWVIFFVIKDPNIRRTAILFFNILMRHHLHE